MRMCSFLYDSRKRDENKVLREVELHREVKREGIHLPESFQLPVIHISHIRQEEALALQKPYLLITLKGTLVI